jgi:hypothetical protein
MAACGNQLALEQRNQISFHNQIYNLPHLYALMKVSTFQRLFQYPHIHTSIAQNAHHKPKIPLHPHPLDSLIHLPLLRPLRLLHPIPPPLKPHHLFLPPAHPPNPLIPHLPLQHPHLPAPHSPLAPTSSPRPRHFLAPTLGTSRNSDTLPLYFHWIYSFCDRYRGCVFGTESCGDCGCGAFCYYGWGIGCFWSEYEGSSSGK